MASVMSQGMLSMHLPIENKRDCRGSLHLVSPLLPIAGSNTVLNFLPLSLLLTIVRCALTAIGILSLITEVVSSVRTVHGTPSDLILVNTLEIRSSSPKCDNDLIIL